VLAAGVAAAAALLLAGAVAGSLITSRRAGGGTTASTAGSSGQAAPPSTGQPAQATEPPQSTAAGAADVRVARQGFTRLGTDPGEAKVTYAVLVSNPRSDQVASGVRVVLTFADRAGRPLKTKDKDLDVLLPGQTAAVAGDADVPGVAAMRAQVLVGRWEPARGATGRVTATNVRTTRTAADELRTTATLRSTFAGDVTDAKAVAVYYSRTGQLLGGDSGDVDRIPAGGSVGVLIEGSHAPPDVARTEVYTSLKDLPAVGG